MRRRNLKIRLLKHRETKTNCMPRPKGSSKKEKNQSSSSSPLLSVQTYSNDDLNWISMESKNNRSKKCEYEERIIPIGSSSDINGGRVVVNPAVLRYLEQNRNLSTSHRNLPMSEGKEENFAESNLFTCERANELREFNQNDRCWDISVYSTEFLTSARLAEWILMHSQSAKCSFIQWQNNSFFFLLQQLFGIGPLFFVLSTIKLPRCYAK